MSRPPQRGDRDHSHSAATAPSGIGFLSRFWVRHRSEVRAKISRNRLPGYGLVFCFMLYVALRYAFNSQYHSIFDGINLAIHEGGHLLFRFFGTFIMIAGGTWLQLLVPLACCFYFYRRREYFGIGFGGLWLAANCYHVAIYVADARAQALPLVTVGGGYPIHDWHYLLSALGLLTTDTVLALLVRSLGFILMWVAILYSGWLLLEMKSAPAKVPDLPA